MRDRERESSIEHTHTQTIIYKPRKGKKRTFTLYSLLSHIGLIAAHAFQMWFHLLFILQNDFESVFHCLQFMLHMNFSHHFTTHQIFAATFSIDRYIELASYLYNCKLQLFGLSFDGIAFSLLFFCVLLLEILLQICCRLILCHTNSIATF